MANLQPLFPSAPGQYNNTAPDSPATVNLSTSQTGNADSTNTLDRGNINDANVLLKIVSVVGSTPTVTIACKVSYDATTWYDAPTTAGAVSATNAAPTWAALALVVATATTNWIVVKGSGLEYPWRYLKLVYSLNTNVTLTVDAIMS